VTTRERLGIAALLSLCLHGLVISGEWLPMPQMPGEPRPLEARLARVDLVAPKPQLREVRRAASVATPAAPRTVVPGALALPAPEVEAEEAEEAAEQPAAAPEPQRLATTAPVSVAAAHSLPRRGRIAYNLYYSSERNFIGRATQTWEVDNDEYILASDAETGGLVEVFRPQRLHSISRGKVTPDGLKPESFLTSRTRRGRTDVAQARFDWEAGNLTYGNARDSKTARLAPGAQDLMSFIFQFVLLPPRPGRYQLPIATGTRFEVYGFEIRPEEPLETPIGTVRALPIRQLQQSGVEGIEMWLAAEYRYLPVHIRHYDRDGNLSGEQIVNEIRISEE
jgi:hypothetical protein